MEYPDNILDLHYHLSFWSFVSDPMSFVDCNSNDIKGPVLLNFYCKTTPLVSLKF